MLAQDNLFAELPAALVEEVLQQTSAGGALLLKGFEGIRSSRADYRDALVDRRLLIHESTLGCPPAPTTCGADGSYAIERLLAADLAAAAAVAVEGLTPPSEKRFWQEPRHSTFVVPEVHSAETATVLRAVMLGRELLLAVKAPHDLVMIDGSATLPIIYFNQAAGKAAEASELHCSEEFTAHCVEYLESYRTILCSRRSDKNYVAVPKYSTRREIGRAIDWPPNVDDRGLLTLLLHPGELTEPTPLEQPTQPWHLHLTCLDQERKAGTKALVDDIRAALQSVHVFYYRPQQWLPALRVEVARDVAVNKHRLAAVVQGLKHQCATGSILEPYPLYLADRMVKSLARALPAFRQVATQAISESYEGDIGEVFFAMHGYRSESGMGS